MREKGSWGFPRVVAAGGGRGRNRRANWIPPRKSQPGQQQAALCLSRPVFPSFSCSLGLERGRERGRERQREVPSGASSSCSGSWLTFWGEGSRALSKGGGRSEVERVVKVFESLLASSFSFFSPALSSHSLLCFFFHFFSSRRGEPTALSFPLYFSAMRREMTKTRLTSSPASRRRSSSRATGLWAALAVMLLAVTIRATTMMPLSSVSKLLSSFQGLRSQRDLTSAPGGEEVSFGLLLPLGRGAWSRENRGRASWGRDAIALALWSFDRNDLRGEKKKERKKLTLAPSLSHSLCK